MKLEHITFKENEKPNFEGLEFEVPSYLKSILSQINGYIQYHGGFHLRGICKTPEWHSLQEVMHGKFSLHMKYPSLLKTDLLFAQDCMADQLFLREGNVYKLYSESGDIEFLESSIEAFFTNYTENPIEYLGLEPLLQFQSEGKNLNPGEVLCAYPPFCTEQAKAGVTLGAIPISEALNYLPEIAEAISNLAEGEELKIEVVK